MQKNVLHRNVSFFRTLKTTCGLCLPPLLPFEGYWEHYTTLQYIWATRVLREQFNENSSIKFLLNELIATWHY